VINIKKPREGFWFLSGEEAEIIRLQRGFELKKRERKGRWSKKKNERWRFEKEERRYKYTT
jgi:hypothetical protein